ncbi:hypothetical protein MnTg03_00387 [bacterium MnTg03]|nr:hypothetical protein MnTg03_00387 [bacterium MnTg03]
MLWTSGVKDLARFTAEKIMGLRCKLGMNAAVNIHDALVRPENLVKTECVTVYTEHFHV